MNRSRALIINDIFVAVHFIMDNARANKDLDFNNQQIHEMIEDAAEEWHFEQPKDDGDIE